MRFQPRIFENEVPVQKNRRPPPTHRSLPPTDQPTTAQSRQASHHHLASSSFLTILPLLPPRPPPPVTPATKQTRLGPPDQFFHRRTSPSREAGSQQVYISQPSPRVVFSRESVSGCHFISFFRISLPRSRDPTRVHGPPVSTAHIPNSDFEFPATQHRIRLLCTKRTLFPSLPSPLHRHTRCILP